MAQYMKINSIRGDVTTKGFEGCIDLQGLNHIGNRHVSQRVGTSNREIGILHLGHMLLQKQTDASSADLWHHFLSGESIKELTITRCHLNQGTAEWQSKITLHNVMISNIQEDTNDKGANESVELAYSKIERGFRSQSSSGNWQSPKHVAFDIEAAKVG